MNGKGYLPHHLIRGFVFWTLSLCIAVATVAGILWSWDVIGEEMANRCFWTAFVLALGSVAFLIVNFLFGDLGQLLFGEAETLPTLDPAFSERLKKAKLESPSGDVANRADKSNA